MGNWSSGKKISGIGSSATIEQCRMEEGLAISVTVHEGPRVGVGRDASVGMKYVPIVGERLTGASLCFFSILPLRYSTSNFWISLEDVALFSHHSLYLEGPELVYRTW